MEFLELIIRCAFKGLDLALRAGRGEKSYANCVLQRGPGGGCKWSLAIPKFWELVK